MTVQQEARAERFARLQALRGRLDKLSGEAALLAAELKEESQVARKIDQRLSYGERQRTASRLYAAFRGVKLAAEQADVAADVLLGMVNWP